MRVLLDACRRSLLTTMAEGRLTRAQFANDQKVRYLSMSVEEKRQKYNCGQNYVTLSEIPTWPEYAKKEGLASSGQKTENVLSEKVSVFRGDITTLEIDTIVNAANKSLAGGGGVDGAIHRAAGPDLKAESVKLAPCETGDAKITGGYKLPAKYVIHTVGPIGENASALASCYRRSLALAVENKCRSIAFPCISTGVYGYPNEAACKVALGTVQKFLQEKDNAESIDRVIFCLFMQADIDLYHKYLPEYFPI